MAGKLTVKQALAMLGTEAGTLAVMDAMTGYVAETPEELMTKLATGYLGVLAQDGWETAELTIMAEHPDCGAYIIAALEVLATEHGEV